MQTPDQPFINPYAAPSQSIFDAEPPVHGGQAVFQKNGVLIMHKTAVLPDRCVKSNEPTTDRLKRKLYWHHPAIYFLILLNLLIYAVVSIIIRKSAVIQVPLASRYKQRRIIFMLVAWSFVLAAIGCIVGAIAMGDSRSPLVPILLLSFPVLLVAGVLTGIFGCRVVYAKKIDDNYVWLGGVSRKFLAQYPEWPMP